MTDISDDAKGNREGWTQANAEYTAFSVDWARQWPCEEIWVARKRR